MAATHRREEANGTASESEGMASESPRAPTVSDRIETQVKSIERALMVGGPFAAVDAAPADG